MANYVNIQIADSPPTSGFVNVADSATSSWITHSRQVEVGLYPPTTLDTPTEFKMWGIDGIETEGAASWQTLVTTASGVLADVTGEQVVSVKFRNAGLTESDVITSSGISYSFDEPQKNSSVEWADLTDEATQVAKLVNTSSNVEIEFSKANIPHLKFHGRAFEGLTVGSTAISVDPTSQIGLLINNQSGAYVGVKKTFNEDKKPFVRVDTGSGFKTLTQYDGSPRSDLFGEYLNRIDNYSYTAGSKELTFDVSSFSDYGFATISKIEFTANSQTGGYNTQDLILEVRVIDTNGEGVEGAPVTFSGISGDDIGSFTANPVTTNSSGIAQATLSLDTVGEAMFDAYVDNVHTDPDQLTWCMDMPSDLGRSLLDQEVQIRWTETYDDDVADVNTAEVAEPSLPTTSGNADDVLERDTNVLRTILKQIKGTSNWYDDLGSYFDPTNTDAGGTENTTLSLSNLAGNTLDSQTIITAVEANNSGAGFTVSGTDTGFLFETSIQYASVNDRTGLPIFASISGTYYDETGIDEVCAIDLIDLDTGAEFTDASGNVIYAKFHDGADFGGTGDGTDVYVRFYANDTTYDWTASDPTSIMMIYPRRRVMSDVEEYEWTRTDFVSGFEGDTVIVEDIVDLWSYTGAIDGDTLPTWTNTGDNYTVVSGTSLQAALDAINDGIGDMTFLEQNYITDSSSVASALDGLDMGLKDAYDIVSAGTGQKVIEEPGVRIDADTEHPIPYGLTYTPDSTPGREGRNMDVYINGQLLTASTGVNGVNFDGDYQELSASGISFANRVGRRSNIIYVIRQ
jgi:hypothetical protein